MPEVSGLARGARGAVANTSQASSASPRPKAHSSSCLPKTGWLMSTRVFLWRAYAMPPPPALADVQSNDKKGARTLAQGAIARLIVCEACEGNTVCLARGQRAGVLLAMPCGSSHAPLAPRAASEHSKGTWFHPGSIRRTASHTPGPCSGSLPS